jgi:hypothetical protein
VWPAHHVMRQPEDGEYCWAQCPANRLGGSPTPTRPASRPPSKLGLPCCGRVTS